MERVSLSVKDELDRPGAHVADRFGSTHGRCSQFIASCFCQAGLENVTLHLGKPPQDVYVFDFQTRNLESEFVELDSNVRKAHKNYFYSKNNWMCTVVNIFYMDFIGFWKLIWFPYSEKEMWAAALTYGDPTRDETIISLRTL